ncbi:MAG TPA: hypothetical protein VGB90_09600 [Alphaproteobacteria bacterium]
MARRPKKQSAAAAPAATETAAGPELADATTKTKDDMLRRAVAEGTYRPRRGADIDYELVLADDLAADGLATVERNPNGLTFFLRATTGGMKKVRDPDGWAADRERERAAAARAAGGGEAP